MFTVLFNEIQSFLCVEIVCIEYILTAAIAYDPAYFVLNNELLEKTTLSFSHT